MLKKRSKYRPFAEARSFVRSLKLSSHKEWLRYCRKGLEAYPPKPKDIPNTPQRVYKAKGWAGTRDWLGTDFCSFAEARSFARSLKLSSQKEWVKYCRGEMKGCPPRPRDIPKTPQRVYKSKGWKDTPDWLGTKKVSCRTFAEARSFVRSLKLSSQKEWVKYCRGELEGCPPKPRDIPKAPQGVYKGKGWKNTPDWLGSDLRPGNYRPFADARKFVRSLKLSSHKEWLRYCRKGLEAYPPKPKDIPNTPQSVYKGKGWAGTRDWLGTDFRSFAEARSFARSLKLRSQEEWLRYCRGEMKEHPPIPKDIPKTPLGVYQGKGWQGISDWLENGKAARKKEWITLSSNS